MQSTCECRSTAGTEQDEARGYEHRGKAEADRFSERRSLHALLEESFRLALDTRCATLSALASASIALSKLPVAMLYCHKFQIGQDANRTQGSANLLQLPTLTDVLWQILLFSVSHRLQLFCKRHMTG